jgi:hypothetical protein
MKTNNGTAVHTVTSEQFDNQQYCSVATVVTADSISTNLRWSRGDKTLSKTFL